MNLKAWLIWPTPNFGLAWTDQYKIENDKHKIKEHYIQN